MRNEPAVDKKMFDLPKQILAIDRAILFCAVAHKSGYLVTSSPNIEDRNRTDTIVITESKSSFSSLLDEADIEKCVFQMGITCGIMKSWERKLGHIRHFVSYYNKMPLVTIMLDNDYFVLLAITSAKEHNIDHIVSQKIIPILGKIMMPK
jgi:hypothetical protein